MRFLLFLLLLVAPVQAQKLLLVDLDDLGREFAAANPQPLLTAADAVAFKFDKFYTCPLCSPTRATINYGVRSTHPDLQAPHLIGPNHSHYRTPTDGPLVTLGNAVSAAGFTTAKIGKWHLSLATEHTHPNEHGWQHYAGVMSNHGSYFDFPVVEDGTETPSTGLYLTHLETAAGMRAIGRGYDLVHVSYHSIHKPFHNPPGYTGVGEVAMAQNMLEDLCLEAGKLVDAGIKAGYTVMLWSDNGGVATLGGAKGSVSDKGSRTFLYCYGPGIPAGQSDALVGSLDLYATVLDFFGIAQAPDMGPESQSVIPLFGGARGRSTIFTERYQENEVPPQDALWRTAVVGPRYKYNRHFGQDRLYDLDNDPLEQTNLLLGPGSPEIQDALAALQQEFQTWTQ